MRFWPILPSQLRAEKAQAELKESADKLKKAESKLEVYEGMENALRQGKSSAQVLEMIDAAKMFKRYKESMDEILEGPLSAEEKVAAMNSLGKGQSSVRRVLMDISYIGYYNETMMKRIKSLASGGPITVSEYMRMCLSSPAGYYSQEKPLLGAKGDFVTAPEVSQIFGELIGAWVLNELTNTGHTGEWQLVELGPGSGALMGDVLRALKRLKAKNFTTHLVETSQTLAALQKRNLCRDNSIGDDMEMPSSSRCKAMSEYGVEINWHTTLQDIPEKFSVFLANEFFDALPMHQFHRDELGVWHEVYVNLDGDEQLCFMLSKGENLHTKALISESIRGSRDYWEVCPLAGEYAAEIVNKFTRNGGFALIVDYGHNGERTTPSLRAYRQHEVVDPLEAPGEIDITADVNFGLMGEALRSECLVYGPVEQRKFLSELGIAHRLGWLLRQSKSVDEANYLLRSVKLLIGDEKEGGMGTHFKAMSLFPKTLAEIMEMRGGPAGFSTDPAQLEK